jgi:ribosomal protein S18 acetylase RimI-like enzyme
VSIDAWHGAVFDRIAAVMLADLPRPLYTVVDEADLELTVRWEQAGFGVRRREWEYLVPTDPQATGLGSVRPPRGVKIVPAGDAQEIPLRALDRAIRDEVEASVGWQEMPAEVLPRPDGVTVLHPLRYAVAALPDAYVGLLRLGPRIRRPRIGLVAVRAQFQRRGIALALLAHALGALHKSGVTAASADVNESNAAATALFEGIGARRGASNLELVHR